MKLATALSERSNIQVKIDELNNRLLQNAKVQDGEYPAEEPIELLNELTKSIQELEKLISHINLTNSHVEKDGVTLTQYLAKRDCLSKKYSVLRNFLNEASHIVHRYSRAEIKIVSTVKVPELQKQVDLLAKELRQTDETIQELNWTTELM